MAREGETEKQWHLDRKVPITIFIALAIYLIGGVRWVTEVEGAQQQLDRRIMTLEAGLPTTAADRLKIGILEANLEALKEQVTESRKVLDEIRTLLIQERNREPRKGQ